PAVKSAYRQRGPSPGELIPREAVDFLMMATGTIQEKITCQASFHHLSRGNSDRSKRNLACRKNICADNSGPAGRIHQQTVPQSLITSAHENFRITS